MSAPGISFVSPNGHEDREILEDPVDRAILEICATEGYVRTDKHGRDLPDDPQLKLAVYEHFRDRVVVNSLDDVRTDAMSDDDLFARIFPKVTISVPLTPEDDDAQYKAYVALKRKLWGYAGPRPGNFCQESAQVDNLPVVMVEWKVFREVRDMTTGAKFTRQVPVRFFTEDADLIFKLSSQPAAEKLVQAAEVTAKHLLMNTSRHPELVKRVSEETQTALTRSQAALLSVSAPTTATSAAD